MDNYVICSIYNVSQSDLIEYTAPTAEYLHPGIENDPYKGCAIFFLQAFRENGA